MWTKKYEDAIDRLGRRIATLEGNVDLLEDGDYALGAQDFDDVLTLSLLIRFFGKVAEVVDRTEQEEKYDERLEAGSYREIRNLYHWERDREEREKRYESKETSNDGS